MILADQIREHVLTTYIIPARGSTTAATGQSWFDLTPREQSTRPNLTKVLDSENISGPVLDHGD